MRISSRRAGGVFVEDFVEARGDFVEDFVEARGVFVEDFAEARGVFVEDFVEGLEARISSNNQGAGMRRMSAPKTTCCKGENTRARMN